VAHRHAARSEPFLGGDVGSDKVGTEAVDFMWIFEMDDSKLAEAKRCLRAILEAIRILVSKYPCASTCSIRAARRLGSVLETQEIFWKIEVNDGDIRKRGLVHFRVCYNKNTSPKHNR
jgi:hypothetical protein